MLQAKASEGRRKPRKIAAPRPAPSHAPSHAHFNSIDTRTKSKSVAPAGVQVFRFGPPVPAPVPRAPSPVSALDPFVMLEAPDLSGNSYGEYELYQTQQLNIPVRPDVTQSRGRHVSHLLAEPEIEIVTGPPVVTQETLSVRQPKKRKLHYGAFELYQL